MLEDSNQKCLLKEVEKQELMAKEFGFYWENIHQLIRQIHNECAEIQEAWDSNHTMHIQEVVGDLMQAAVSIAVYCKLDPCETLSKSVDKFQRRYDAVVKFVREDGLENLQSQPLDKIMDYWHRAKKETGT